MKTLETLKQLLLNRLNSEDFEKYVDLVNENLKWILEDNYNDCDIYELHWLPNDDDTIMEFLERESSAPRDLISYIKSVNYDECADFVEYNGLATKSYEELRDLYVKMLFDDYYADILAELLILEEVADELIPKLLSTEETLRNKLLKALSGSHWSSYTKLVNEHLNGYLENDDELYWKTNDEESLKFYADALNLTVMDVLMYAAKGRYSVLDSYVQLNAANGKLRSMSAGTLCDLYAERLFSDDYADILKQVLEEIADELKEL